MTMPFENHLDNTVPRLLDELNIPGAAIALVDTGELAAVKTYGYACTDRQIPVSGHTLFQIASISKAVTAWGVMKLTEAGKVDLDAPVGRYLSRWQLPKSAFDHNAVTVRRLLAHTAGVSLEGFKGIHPRHQIPTLEDTLSGRVPPLDELQTAYSFRWNEKPDIERERRPVYLQHPPGQAFHYSGGGFTLLELMIEEVSGQRFSAYMQEHILEPLGMTASSFERREENRQLFATPYTAKGEALPHYGFNARAAGGMYSTIVDLARFACAELPGAGGEKPGRGVISPQSVEAMVSKQVFAESLQGMDFYSALGHFVIDMNGLSCIHHSGGNVGWRSVYAVIPETGAGLCVLINSEAGNDLWMKIMQDWGQLQQRSNGNGNQ